MKDEDPKRFKKIALKILSYIRRKVARGKGFWGKLDWKWLSDGDVNDRKSFIKYVREITKIVKGELGETEYGMLDYTWRDPDYDVVWEFIDNFHDVAHDKLSAGLIKSDSFLFGDKISGMVGKK